MFLENLFKKQTIYLCVEENILEHQIIHGFIIRSFQDYKVASLFFEQNYKNSFIGRHVIIPIYSFIPFFFHKWILDFKLRNIYWLNFNKIIK